jgi:hypothetical protein
MIEPTVIKITHSTRPSLRPHTSMSFVHILADDTISHRSSMTYLRKREPEQSGNELGNDRGHCSQTVKRELASNVRC